MNQFTVRSISPEDFDQLTRMHADILWDEFIVRFGWRFLRRYYQAFSESPHAVALVTIHNDTGQILGALLGTLSPPLHYRFLTRRHGVFFLGIILLQSLLHFSLARDLFRTRVKRYMKGVIRSMFGKRELLDIENNEGPFLVGDITHLFVDREKQSSGIGTALVCAFNSIAKDAGIQRVDLVTVPVELGGAGPFYEKLGWELQERIVSQSGEEFLLYHLRF